MSAAVGAALKKIAVALLSNPKTLKTVGGIVLGIIIIIIMPIIAVVSVFNGDVNIDTDRLQELIEENMSIEEIAKLQFVENTMYEIEDAMLEAGFTSRVREAQVLYILALSDYAHDPDFTAKLVGCFAEDQSDSELINAVNSAFGTDIRVDDFKNVMDGIRAVYIDTSEFTDSETKNNLDLVIWAKNAEKAGWGYVWGTYGEVLSQELYETKLAQYPNEVGNYSDFIEQNWLGRRTADCIGFIKGYGWYNAQSRSIEVGSNGMPDIGSDTMYQNAVEKGPISTIPEIPGLAVWHEGHIGVYIGDGEIIEAMGTQHGVVKTQLAGGRWTHWLKIPYITYIEEDESE